MDKHADDAQLVADLEAGGSRREAAVKRLYRKLGSRLGSYFRSKGLDEAAAEDLVQETFLKLLRGIGGYRGESPLRAWIWSIARNELRIYWRAAMRREDPQAPDDLALLRIGSDDEARELGELVDCVRAAFERFAERFRPQAEALRLIVQYGWGIAEVARHLVSPAALVLLATLLAAPLATPLPRGHGPRPTVGSASGCSSATLAGRRPTRSSMGRGSMSR